MAVTAYIPNLTGAGRADFGCDIHALLTFLISAVTTISFVVDGVDSKEGFLMAKSIRFVTQLLFRRRPKSDKLGRSQRWEAFH